MAQGGATNDGVVNTNEIIFLSYNAVGDVIDVRDHLRASFFLADKGAELDVFMGDFFATWPVVHDEVIKATFGECAFLHGRPDGGFNFFATNFAHSV